MKGKWRLPTWMRIGFVVLSLAMAALSFGMAHTGSYFPAPASLASLSGRLEQASSSQGEVRFALEGQPFVFNTRAAGVDTAAVLDALQASPHAAVVLVYDTKTVSLPGPRRRGEVYALAADGKDIFTVDDVANAIRREDRKGWVIGAVFLLCAAGLGRSVLRPRRAS